ncbi:MAG: hypothetical protein JO056_02570 [Alphaproteobacteria bacterium]|nr:hypothetical protein [Alphaproteobacteria bacterium]
MRDRAAQAEHYRNKAEETRIIAESMQHEETRQFLMRVSHDYSMLAGVLERTTLGDVLPASE